MRKIACILFIAITLSASNVYAFGPGLTLIDGALKGWRSGQKDDDRHNSSKSYSDFMSSQSKLNEEMAKTMEAQRKLMEAQAAQINRENR